MEWNNANGNCWFSHRGVQTVTPATSAETESDKSVPVQKKMRLDPFADLRDEPCTSQAQPPTESESCEGELSRYKMLKVPVSTANKNPLNYWKANSVEYPILAQVARRLFCISASSAQSERDFSSVGATITDVRSRLSPEKVEAIELLRWGMRAGFSST